MDSRYSIRFHFNFTSDSFKKLEALAETDIRGRVQELWMIPSVLDGSHAESDIDCWTSAPTPHLFLGIEEILRSFTALVRLIFFQRF